MTPSPPSRFRLRGAHYPAGTDKARSTKKRITHFPIRTLPPDSLYVPLRFITCRRVCTISTRSSASSITRSMSL